MMNGKAQTHSKLLERRKAMGTPGSMICSQAFSMSTLRMSLRLTFFKLDLDPRVATSLVTVRGGEDTDPRGLGAQTI